MQIVVFDNVDLLVHALPNACREEGNADLVLMRVS